MRLSFIIIVTLFIILIGSACKKQIRYVEDPKSVTTTPNDRLTGTWKIGSYTLNGTSIVDKLNALSGNKVFLQHIEMTYSYEDSYKYWHLSMLDPIGGIGNDIRNPFDDVLYLQLGPGDTLFNKWFITPLKCLPGAGSNFWGPVASWSVTELYHNDFHIQLQTDTGLYKIEWYK